MFLENWLVGTNQSSSLSSNLKVQSKYMKEYIFPYRSLPVLWVANQIIWVIINQEYLGILIVSLPPAVSYIYRVSLLQKKPVISLSNCLSHFLHTLSFSNKLLQTEFQTILLFFSSAVSSSYTKSFSYHHP